MRARPDRFAAAGGILSYFTRHATAANLLLAAMVGAGLAALPQMRAQYFPDVVIETVDVGVTWQGAGADDLDRGVVQLLEPGLMAVEGVEDVSATSREGRATVSLEFEPGWDMGRAVNDVEATVAAVTNLPADAEDPTVTRRVWRDRVTDMVITGPVAPEQLVRIADEFLSRLYQAGVTRATIEGAGAPEISVDLSLADLMRHDLTLSEVADRIATETKADPAGEVGDGSARLRTGAERRDAAELGQIVLRSEAEGATLLLSDVAQITDTGAAGTHTYFVGDNPAITLRADRSAEGDAIEIHRLVAKVAAEMRPTLPEGVTIDLIRQRAADISARLDVLIGNGISGLCLVLALLFLFLNARTALWVAAGIPIAMLACVAAMYLFGLTFNMISLFALILTSGIVVDDAIVVGEHTDFRARHLGEPPFVAAENAVRAMAGPVFSSSLTTIIAFLGVTAITGRFGDLLQDIPFAVTAVLVASLVETFLILPNHMAGAVAESARDAWYDAPNRVANRGLGWVRDRLIRPLTGWVLVARYPVLAGAIALLAYHAGLFIRGDVQWRFFQSPETPSITGNFTMIPGATRDDTLAEARALQEAVRTVAAQFRADHGVEPLSYVLAEVGANGYRPLASAEGKDADLLGSVTIELIDPDLRTWSGAEFLAAVEAAVPPNPMLEELSFRGWHSGPGGDTLEVELSGADAVVLKRAAEALKLALAPFPEVSALEDNLPYDKDEIVLELTSQGRALGFTAAELGRELRARLSGIKAASIPDGTRSIDVIVGLPQAELTSDFLDRMLMRTPAGGYVPLADLVNVSRMGGFATIRREMGMRVVTVSGDVSSDDPERANAIHAAIERDILPRIASEYGVGYSLAGLAEQENRFLSDALLGLLAALAGMYGVLAWIFASWLRPIVVMAVIPLGLIGAIHGHAAWGVPMSMFSVVGLIGMSGIIINDAIVLVSTIDDYARTRALGPAIVAAVGDRLRPVMLTTATTVLGLAPLLFESSSQALFLKPTVITLCYGLGFGFVLVLLVVPALVMVQKDAVRAIAAFRRSFGVPGIRGLAGTGIAAGLVLFAGFFGQAFLAGGGLGHAFAGFMGGMALTVLVLGMIGGWRLKRARAAQPLQP